MSENLTWGEYEVLLRHDLATFAGRCFQDLNPQTCLATNWHLEVIAAKLAEVRDGKIRRLIINLPPRHLKSLLASIAFPAWCLGHDPSAQILCVSYAQDLADKLARDCRSIMMSPWYRQLFPTRLAPHRQAVQEFITTRQGYRLATSTGGVLTGRGADIILIDDPLKPDEALSDAQRQGCNEWYDHTLYSRLNDKQHGAIVIIMQRLHEDDLVGHVLAQEPWEVVSFPAIAEADEVHHIETIWGARRFTRCRGEALHPEREPLDTLDRIRRTVGEYNFAGQYQQSPAPLGGGLVKAEWFKRYREDQMPKRFDRIVQSWDTANKATELSDFSVCTTWGVKDKNLLLLAVFRRRLEYPQLKRAVREQQSLFGANVVLIEDKASGTQLIQELIEERCSAVTRYEPTLDKIMRLHAQTAMIENGFVHLPENAPWLAEYLHELTVFPNGKHDDQADSTAQFLDWCKKRGPNDGFYEWLRMEAERFTNPERDRERHRVLLEAPPYMSVQTLSGRHLNVPSDGTLELSADDAEGFIRIGWRKIGEGIIDPDLYDGEQITEIDEPEGPKTIYAKGCVEWEKQQEEERLARIAAEEAAEKRRLARVAALRGKTL
ncbi:MAG: phage terminase large subunit [Alphaproteobacteria bacterium]|nr:phage terminase large subunit [Alphaproteobacteria bacterium]